jgi:hypothetical protein
MHAVVADTTSFAVEFVFWFAIADLRRLQRFEHAFIDLAASGDMTEKVSCFSTTP